MTRTPYRSLPLTIEDIRKELSAIYVETEEEFIERRRTASSRKTSVLRKTKLDELIDVAAEGYSSRFTIATLTTGKELIDPPIVAAFAALCSEINYAESNYSHQAKVETTSIGMNIIRKLSREELEDQVCQLELGKRNSAHYKEWKAQDDILATKEKEILEIHALLTSSPPNNEES
jgi:hypothetical protein